MPHTNGMTDVPPPLNNDRQPQGSQTAAPRRRRPQQSPPPSRESRFIGYLILGFGAVALLSVIIIALSNPTLDTDEALPDEQTTARLQETIQQTGVSVPSVQAPAPSAPQLVLPRAKSVKESQIAGGWQAQIGDYVAVLQMKDGAFQVILAHPNPARARLHSSGSYRLIDDIVALEPRLDWKAPVSQGVSYERLTTGSYPMIAGFKDGAMVWQNVPREDRRIYVPPRSPLLLDPQKNYIVWRRAD